jgi:DNA-binding NtrC family response regulator
MVFKGNSAKLIYIKLLNQETYMKKLVFIVEDNIVQQKLLQVHFEERLGNYTVRTFSDPAQMMSHLKEKPFAVVLDHFFGDANDKTGLHYLKEMSKDYSSIPVIYYTTLNSLEVRAEVLKLGAAEYIIKDSASLVRLRTALDQLHAQSTKKKGFFEKLFKKS